MKYLFLILVFIFVETGYAQPVVQTYKDAKRASLSIKKLDKKYPSAIHIKPGLGVFDGKMEAFTDEYVKMIQDLNSFLSQHDFTWKKRTRMFQRIYFNKDGGIDYYLVNLSRSGLSTKQKKRLLNLLKKFSKNYHFPLQAKTNFAQCVPIIFTASKSKSNQQKQL